MATSEERMRILTMIQEKQITAEEGARLLAALNTGAAERPAGAAAGSARWLRVRVSEAGTGRQKANVTLPLGLVDIGLKMGAKFAPDLQGMDLAAIQAAIKSGVQGRIIDLQDDEDGERVEIFVE